MKVYVQFVMESNVVVLGHFKDVICNALFNYLIILLSLESIYMIYVI